MNLSPVHSARSLVNNYELILLETSHSSKDPSQAQLQKCFKIFDEIIPVLGQYQRVMKLIRDELYDAVFSREYTIAIEPDLSTVPVVAESESRAWKPSIERVPHFVILNKIMDERNKRAEDAEEHVEQSKAAMEELNEKIRLLNMHIDGLEAAIASQDVEIQELKGDIAKHIEESSQLGMELQTQREDMMNKTSTLECSIETLNAELAQENTKVIELSRFKKCHDDIQDDFRDPSAFSTNPKKALFSAKEQKLRNDINEGEILENQLLKLRNTCIDEFEEYLETRVLEESEGVSADKEPSVEERRPRKAEERQGHETAFTSMITNLENELEQNQLHLSILKTDLDKLNQIRRESKAKDVQISEYHKDSPNDETDLLEVIKNASSNYQFLPQEPILNKYAITAFYSCNQGRTFHALQDVQQCKSCRQETLVCPHKVTTAERIFHLPLQCTHIKFSRPGLPATSPRDLSIKATPSCGFQSVHSKKVYARLWNDLATREHPFTIRKIPRSIEEDYLVSLIEQFYVLVVSDDMSNANEDEDECVPLLVSWYAFLNNRYQVPSVALLVARDVVEAIATTAHSNGHVQLFAESLCGNLDPAAFRYYLILSRLVKTIQWVSMEDFFSFVKIVYPFMNVDDLEQFTMSYISFSENKISGKLICEFLLQIILKQREPNFHEMEIKLLNHLESSNASMNDVVFFEAIAEISPLSSERLCHRLFAQSKVDSEACHVSVSRLSQIGSFLDLHQRTAVMEMEVEKKFQVQ